MNRPIPGYYFDSQRQRYFKIEKEAPPGAAWSADSVKRRKYELKVAKAEEKRAQLVKRSVKRSKVFRDPLVGGFLNREFGFDIRDQEARAAARDGPCASYASSLVSKGSVRFMPIRDAAHSSNLPTFWVGASHLRQGSPVALTTTSWDQFSGAVLPTDEIGRISHEHAVEPNRRRYWHGMNAFVQDIAYIEHHAPTDCLFLGQKSFRRAPVVGCLKLRQSDKDDQLPFWETDPQRSAAEGTGNVIAGYANVHQLVAAPAFVHNELACTLGTSKGIIRWGGPRRSQHMDWLLKRDPYDGDLDGRADVLSHCYHATNPRVILTGTRKSTVGAVDIRAPYDRLPQLSFRHASSVVHMRSLKNHDNQILVAGLRSTMAIYDLRFIKDDVAAKRPFTTSDGMLDPPGSHYDSNRDLNGGRSRRPWGHNPALPQPGGPGSRKRRPAQVSPDQVARHNLARNVGQLPQYPTTPLLTFPSYQNEAQVSIGFDVNDATDVVAAAHDDGTVKLHSLVTGRVLRSRDIETQIRAATSIKCLRFQKTDQNDTHSSLWAGVGASIQKFSVSTATEMGEEE